MRIFITQIIITLMVIACGKDKDTPKTEKQLLLPTQNKSISLDLESEEQTCEKCDELSKSNFGQLTVKSCSLKDKILTLSVFSDKAQKTYDVEFDTTKTDEEILEKTSSYKDETFIFGYFQTIALAIFSSPR